MKILFHIIRAALVLLFVFAFADMVRKDIQKSKEPKRAALWQYLLLRP